MRRRSIPLVVLGAIVVLLGLAQLLATPVARWYLRRELDNLNGYRGRAGDVRASLFPPSLQVEQLSIIPEPNGSWEKPLLSVARVRAVVEWKKLLKGHLVAVASVDQPKLNVVEDERAARGGPSPPPDLGSELARAAPLRIDVLQVRGGAVDYVRRPIEIEVYIHDVQLMLENLATRPRLSRGEPTTLEMTGVVQHTGAMAASVRVYPWTRGLTFEGRAELRHLSARDLQSLGGSTSDVKPASGSIDVFAQFQCRDGTLSGGVKPVAHDLAFEPADSDLWSRIKSGLADITTELLGRKESSSSSSKEVATVIPIKGRITDPNAQVWPTVFGVIRNAFVEGLGGGFADVPPETAAQPQSPAEQALQALKKGSGPPKAQPQGRAPARR